MAVVQGDCDFRDKPVNLNFSASCRQILKVELDIQAMKLIRAIVASGGLPIAII
jgi:hypothetical protein